MEKEFQTSFIPKKPLAVERAPSRARPVGAVVLLSLLLFVLSVVFAGGAYLYRSYLMGRIEAMRQSLVLAEGEFERGVVDELELLERRLGAAREVLSRHIVVSPLFRVLEETTLPTVRFTDFSYGVTEDAPGVFTVEMEGEATSYTQIALQSDVLGKNKNLKNVIFSDLSLGDRGTVLFTLSFALDSSFILYERSLAFSSTTTSVGSLERGSSLQESSMLEGSEENTQTTNTPASSPGANANTGSSTSTVVLPDGNGVGAGSGTAGAGTGAGGPTVIDNQP